MLNISLQEYRIWGPDLDYAHIVICKSASRPHCLGMINSGAYYSNVNFELLTPSIRKAHGDTRLTGLHVLRQRGG